MAISDLEQRLKPLDQTGFWLPFGALCIPPWMEHEILEEESLWTVTRSRRRHRTWAGYCPHRLTRDALEEPAKGDGASLAGMSAEGRAGLLGRQPGCHEFPELRKGSTCVGSDCETDTPVSRKSSDFSSTNPGDDWETPLDEFGHTGEEDKFDFAMILPTGQPCCTNGYDQQEHDIQGTLEADAAPPQQPVTTFMVQNLSRTLTRRGLMDMLNGYGFAQDYNFVHLPMTFGSGKNKGFAFVNFVCPKAAAEFAGKFPQSDGAQIKDKIWRVAPAAVQGFEANVMAASSKKMARVRNSAFKPLVVAPPCPAANAAPPSRQEVGKRRRSGVPH